MYHRKMIYESVKPVEYTTITYKKSKKKLEIFYILVMKYEKTRLNLRWLSFISLSNFEDLFPAAFYSKIFEKSFDWFYLQISVYMNKLLFLFDLQWEPLCCFSISFSREQWIFSRISYKKLVRQTKFLRNRNLFQTAFSSFKTDSDPWILVFNAACLNIYGII